MRNDGGNAEGGIGGAGGSGRGTRGGGRELRAQRQAVTRALWSKLSRGEEGRGGGLGQEGRKRGWAGQKGREMGPKNGLSLGKKGSKIGKGLKSKKGVLKFKI